ncbi:MAG: hypothetical protein GC199_02350 [Alphaproteobacteria bacterium]|nr:hypothetical protein [Alphaproteobacteria bacterium]
MSEPSVSRREALQRVGKIAAYSAPAAIVLLTAERALARSVSAPAPTKSGKTVPPGYRRYYHRGLGRVIVRKVK